MTTLPWFGALLSDRREPCLSTASGPRAIDTGERGTAIFTSCVAGPITSLRRVEVTIECTALPFGIPVAAASQRGRRSLRGEQEAT